MQIVIDIPEKEFGIDMDDKFQDFFSRLKAEIKAHLISNTSLVCGAYELETIDMFLKAFNNGTPLPKGHGRLIDADELEECKEIMNTISGESKYAVRMNDIRDMSTILEADKAESKDKPKGRWIDIGNEGLVFRCSLCGNKNTIESNYCPNCGAKMSESGDKE